MFSITSILISSYSLFVTVVFLRVLYSGSLAVLSMIIILRGFLLLARFGDKIYSRNGMCEDSAFALQVGELVTSSYSISHVFPTPLLSLSYGLYPRITT